MGELELFLFSTDAALAARAITGGVRGVVVDWERRGKSERQRGADTQINHDTVADLRRMRGSTSSRVICRVNGFGAWTADEIELALGNGADEILLPMVRDAAEVAEALSILRGRAPLGILVETPDAVSNSEALGRLRIARVYFGLMDLAIARGSRSPFEAVADGTVERVRAAFDIPFGFAGLTLPEGGTPVPSRLLAAEMLRLRCGFTFLRRSYLRDVRGRDIVAETRRLRAWLADAKAVTGGDPAARQRELRVAIASWPCAAAVVP